MKKSKKKVNKRSTKDCLLIFMSFLAVAIISGFAVSIFIIHDAEKLDFLIRYGAHTLLSMIDFFDYAYNARNKN